MPLAPAFFKFASKPRSKLLPILSSQDVVDLLNQIGRDFGKDVLSIGHKKLLRIAYASQKEKFAGVDKAPDIDISNPFLYVLETCYVALARKQVSTAFFTGPNLGAETKTSKPGLADLCMARMAMLKYMATLVAAISDSKMRTELQAILQVFAKPLKYHAEVPLQEASETAAASEEGEQEKPPLAHLAKGKLAQELVRIWTAVMDGEHDTDLLVYTVQDKPVASFADPVADAVRKLDLTKTLANFCRLLELAANVTKASEDACANKNLRALARHASNEDGADQEAAHAKQEEERQKCWRMATAVRKKLVTFSVFKESASAQEIMTNMKWKAEQGESHRLLVLSADLIEEHPSTPWIAVLDKPPASQKADLRLEFLSRQSGPADILLCFDGRSKAARKWMDAKMPGDAVEILLTYAGKRPNRFRTRQVLFASKNSEVGLVHVAFARTKLPLQQRKNWAMESESLLAF